MNIDPKTKSGRFVMLAISDKMSVLRAICDNPSATENEIADASNDRAFYQSILDALIAERDFDSAPQPEWITKGKSITQLIQELGTFEDQSLQVRLTFDGGETHKPVSILTRRDGYAMIEYCGL